MPTHTTSTPSGWSLGKSAKPLTAKGNMDTTTVGNITEGAVLAALMKAGHVVLVPFGLQAGYDLVYEHEGQFHTVQCKTGRVMGGAIVFNTCTMKGGKGSYVNRPYQRDQVKFFGVYCPTTDKCYLVPSTEVGKREGRLRLTPPKNGQRKGVRWAKDYEVRE